MNLFLQSTNKKSKLEKDESSSKPSKGEYQDSSDITGDTEPFDFMGGEDS